MRQGIIGGVVGAVLGAIAVLGVGAVSENEDRDACARLADLRAGTVIDGKTDLYIAILGEDDGLLDDCIKGR